MSESISLDYGDSEDDRIQVDFPSSQSSYQSDEDDNDSASSEDVSPTPAESIFEDLNKPLEELAHHLPDGIVSIQFEKNPVTGTKVTIQKEGDVFEGVIFETMDPEPQPLVQEVEEEEDFQLPDLQPMQVARQGPEDLVEVLNREDLGDDERVRLIKQFATEHREDLRQVYHLYYEEGGITPQPHVYCRLCNGRNHSAQNCLVFANVPLRRTAARVFTLCRRCLNQHHDADSCNDTCRVCGDAHSSALCDAEPNVRRLEAKARQFHIALERFVRIRRQQNPNL